jgi:hypothetical protein
LPWSKDLVVEAGAMARTSDWLRVQTPTRTMLRLSLLISHPCTTSCPSLTA